MLYVFAGADVVKTRTSAHEFVAAVAEAGALVRMVTSDQYEQGVIASISQSTSLFGGKELTVFDTFSERPEAFAELVEYAEVLASSPQDVVVIEGKLAAEYAKAFKQYAEKYIESTAAEKDFFNPFSMADALAKKDKKSLWVLLMRAQAAGLSAEEIIGTLFWQLKSMQLARITTSAAEAGMKDFPYNKAKSALKLYPNDTLERTTEALVNLYHEGHLGRDIDLALEQWVLTL